MLQAALSSLDISHPVHIRARQAQVKTVNSILLLKGLMNVPHVAPAQEGNSGPQMELKWESKGQSGCMDGRKEEVQEEDLF